MVLLENAIADQNSASFYASLPREKSLLCCVCHEHNTTFRYEVIYKSGPNKLENDKNNVISQQVTLTTSVDDDDDDSHDYYNFPPRHPRHGHLKWPIWRPLVTSEESLVHESICITTYPDYPVHLPTFTLKRVASVIKSSAQKGRHQAENMLFFSEKSSARAIGRFSIGNVHLDALFCKSCASISLFFLML